MLYVYGGAGFVGRNLIKRTSYDAVPIPRNQYSVQSSKTDDILYLISTVHNYHIHSDIHKDVDVNLTTFLTVLDNARKNGCRTFNFISSWFVYGDCELPATETTYCNPKGFYSITKRTAEQLLISYCETFNINYRILRLCNVYGEDDDKVSIQRNAMQFLIKELIAGNDIKLYDGGSTIRDYMHVDDVADAIDICLKYAPINTVVNIGSGRKIFFKDIMRQAKEISGSKANILSMEPTDFHKVSGVKDFYMDTTVLKSLGFKQKISIHDGITRLL